MTIHQCPKCELRFDRKTELDDHCWHDHPDFRHEYPAVPHTAPVHEAAAPTSLAAETAPRPHRHLEGSDLGRWLVPKRGGHPHH